MNNETNSDDGFYSKAISKVALQYKGQETVVLEDFVKQVRSEVKKMKRKAQHISKNVKLGVMLKKILTPEQYESAKKCKYLDWDATFVNYKSEAIFDGFHWEKMPEGYKYWDDKYDDALKEQGK